MQLMERYQSNFHIVADRYAFGLQREARLLSEANHEDEDANGNSCLKNRRTLIDIKSRYNAICHRLPRYKHLADAFYNAGSLIHPSFLRSLSPI
jgi:hypothetical protein